MFAGRIPIRAFAAFISLFYVRIFFFASLEWTRNFLFFSRLLETVKHVVFFRFAPPCMVRTVCKKVKDLLFFEYRHSSR
jgi:hypothetical protein